MEISGKKWGVQNVKSEQKVVVFSQVVNSSEFAEKMRYWDRFGSKESKNLFQSQNSTILHRNVLHVNWHKSPEIPLTMTQPRPSKKWILVFFFGFPPKAFFFQTARGVFFLLCPCWRRFRGNHVLALPCGVEQHPWFRAFQTAAEGKESSAALQHAWRSSVLKAFRTSNLAMTLPHRVCPSLRCKDHRDSDVFGIAEPQLCLGVYIGKFSPKLWANHDKFSSSTTGRMPPLFSVQGTAFPSSNGSFTSSGSPPLKTNWTKLISTTKNSSDIAWLGNRKKSFSCYIR